MRVYKTRSGYRAFSVPRSTYNLDEKDLALLKETTKSFVGMSLHTDVNVRIFLNSDLYLEVKFNLYVELSLKSKSKFERTQTFSLFKIFRVIGKVEEVLCNEGLDYIFVDIYNDDNLGDCREKMLHKLGYKIALVNETPAWRTHGKVMVKYLNNLLV